MNVTRRHLTRNLVEGRPQVYIQDRRGDTTVLVLTRKTGERILIGDDVEIEITEVRVGKVRIGITAPRQVRILRSELVRLERRPVM